MNCQLPYAYQAKNTAEIIEQTMTEPGVDHRLFSS